jgi:hypothetical protein
MLVVLVAVILDALNVGLERRIWHAAQSRKNIYQEIGMLLSSR